MTPEIDAGEALRIAQAWAARIHPDSTVSLTPFDRGYVASRTVPELDPARGRVFDIPVRVVVDGRTGAIAEFPALPVPVVAEMYRDRCVAAERFPPQVLALLTLAGWRPGRDVGPLVDRWWATKGPPDTPLFPLVRGALAEFGGLTLTVARLSFVPVRGDEPAEVRTIGALPAVVVGAAGGAALLVDADGGVHRAGSQIPQRLAGDFGEALCGLLGA